MGACARWVRVRSGSVLFGAVPICLELRNDGGMTALRKCSEKTLWESSEHHSCLEKSISFQTGMMLRRLPQRFLACFSGPRHSAIGMMLRRLPQFFRRNMTIHATEKSDPVSSHGTHTPPQTPLTSFRNPRNP